jgi:hypothetical protein
MGMSLEEPCEISGDPSAERSAGAAEISRCLRPLRAEFREFESRRRRETP